MTSETPLPLIALEPKPVPTDSLGADRSIQDYWRQRASRKNKIELALALVSLALLLVVVVFAELDTSYESATRLTSMIQRIVGIRRSADRPAIGNGGRALDARRLVLVAEADDRQRLIAKTTLERYGYRVVLADSASEAVSLFRQSARSFALVLLQPSGRRDSGEETIRQLKSIRADVPILLSRAPGEKLRAHSAAAGWINRPLGAVPLAEAVARILGTR